MCLKQKGNLNSQQSGIWAEFKPQKQKRMVRVIGSAEFSCAFSCRATESHENVIWFRLRGARRGGARCALLTSEGVLMFLRRTGGLLWLLLLLLFLLPYGGLPFIRFGVRLRFGGYLSLLFLLYLGGGVYTTSTALLKIKFKSHQVSLVSIRQ